MSEKSKGSGKPSDRTGSNGTKEKSNEQIRDTPRPVVDHHPPPKKKK